jgi:hypothetical protein
MKHTTYTYTDEEKSIKNWTFLLSAKTRKWKKYVYANGILLEKHQFTVIQLLSAAIDKNIDEIENNRD